MPAKRDANVGFGPRRYAVRSESGQRMYPWVLSRSPMPPDMSPRDTAQHLSALAPSARKRINSSEPPKNGTTSGAPLRRDEESTEASSTRNIKAASGAVPEGCFPEAVAEKARKPHLKAKFRRADRSNSGGIGRSGNLLLAACVHLGHIRRNGAVAEWLKAAVC